MGLMNFRIRNPSPMQWALVGTAGALVLGLSAAAFASSRRKRVKGAPEKPTVMPEEPEAPEAPEGPAPLEWRVITSNDVGYPWEFPALHVENYPTPGTWFDANNKSGAFDPASGFDAYVRAVLGSALAMAGNDASIASAKGQEPNADIGKKLRRQVRAAIMEVGGINDLLYGQTNLNYAGGNDPSKPGGKPEKPFAGSYVLNDQNRGLNWLPRHADNLDRLQGNESFKRTTSLVGSKLSYPNSGKRQMLIWAPAFDLEPLGPHNAVPTIKYAIWSDGSSTIDPPPQIRALGADLSGVMLPGVPV